MEHKSNRTKAFEKLDAEFYSYIMQRLNDLSKREDVVSVMQCEVNYYSHKAVFLSGELTSVEAEFFLKNENNPSYEDGRLVEWFNELDFKNRSLVGKAVKEFLLGDEA